MRLLAIAFLCAGCHQPSPPPAAPESAPVADAPPPPANPRCVYFKDLRAFLPAALPGFTQVNEEGSTGKYGEVQVSEAKRTFSRAGRELSVRIVDTTMADELGRAIKAAASDASSRSGDDPLSPIITSHAVGFVRFDPSHGDPAETRSEATLFVGDRFVVAVSGLGFTGTDEVRRVTHDLDLAGLSKLR